MFLGFTLSHTTAKRLNFFTLRRLVKWYVKHDCNEDIRVVEWRIERDSEGREVYTKPTRKKFKVVYEKRTVKRNYYTYPYGYDQVSLNVNTYYLLYNYYNILCKLNTTYLFLRAFNRSQLARGC